MITIFDLSVSYVYLNKFWLYVLLYENLQHIVYWKISSCTNVQTLKCYNSNDIEKITLNVTY